MLQTLFLFFVVAALSLAAPANTKRRDWDDGGTEHPNLWPTILRDFYATVGRDVVSTYFDFSNCDRSLATISTTSLSPLTAPGSNFTLSHVAIGRGTQNYTCATSNSSSTPVAVGALATLYNASSIAVCIPGLLALLPDIALQIPLPASTCESLPPANLHVSGHHFFSANGTPVFDLNTPGQALGEVAAQKLESVNAPPGSPMGPLGGEGFGSVAWLKLGKKNVPRAFAGQEDFVNGFQLVYRVNTAGGNAPDHCEGMPSEFALQYAAQYWFFK